MLKSTTKLTVFTAAKIITMNPSWPEGTAVAVADGRIVEVGTLDSLTPWLTQFDYELVTLFEDQVLMPGLIDPHLHPVMAAILLPMHFITAMQWRLPWGVTDPVTTPEDYIQRLREIEHQIPEGEPLFTWGYHHLWHGFVRRAQLNEVSADRPILVWQRSFHEVIMNDAMMTHLGIDEASTQDLHQVDYANGHFYENGLGYAIGKLNPIILSEEWLHHGLDRLRQVAHHGGHTTVGDMAVGLFDTESEWSANQAVLESDETPFRVFCVPHATAVQHNRGDHEKSLAFIQSLPERNSHRFRFGNHVKLFTDGAFFSQLAELQEPGYIDGHLGEWLMTPEQYTEVARVYWLAGFVIHVHCTGDLGVELAVDTLDLLQQEKPRFNHGYTIEHFGFSTPEQIDRLKGLGGSISANVYYLHELSHTYAKFGIGYERASQMARIGSSVAAGMTTSIHSDFPMAPAEPLFNAWVAATRINSEGDVIGEQERLSLDAALRAITIDAAKILGMENEIGSIRAGKSADFVALDKDPYVVGANGLKDLRVTATVFEGRVYPVVRNS